MNARKFILYIYIEMFNGFGFSRRRVSSGMGAMPPVPPTIVAAVTATSDVVEAARIDFLRERSIQATRIALELEAARVAAELEATRVAAELEATRAVEEAAAELEATRVAAEVEAARVDAELEAARVAAEVTVAAELEAARVAAEVTVAAELEAAAEISVKEDEIDTIDE